MKYTRTCLAVLGLSGFFSLAFAGSMGAVSSAPVNQTGYFLGLGGSYNMARVDSDTSGLLNALSGIPPLGEFTGRTGDYTNTNQKGALELQAGYFQPFAESDWLWGLEFIYNYSHTNITANGKGSHITLRNPSVNTIDTINMRTVQTKVNNELLLPAFIGHSFMNGFVYLGAGPSLFDISHRMIQSSDNLSAFYIGNINRISDSKWVWGGVAEAGVTYYLNPSWFLKLNYRYALTGKYEMNNNASYSRAVNRGLNNGTLAYNTQQRLSVQNVALSINRVFNFL